MRIEDLVQLLGALIHHVSSKNRGTSYSQYCTVLVPFAEAHCRSFLHKRKNEQQGMCIITYSLDELTVPGKLICTQAGEGQQSHLGYRAHVSLCTLKSHTTGGARTKLCLARLIHGFTHSWIELSSSVFYNVSKSSSLTMNGTLIADSWLIQ